MHFPNVINTDPPSGRPPVPGQKYDAALEGVYVSHMPCVFIICAASLERVGHKVKEIFSQAFRLSANSAAYAQIIAENRR